jgi:hypothetical protein
VEAPLPVKARLADTADGLDVRAVQTTAVARMLGLFFAAGLFAAGTSMAAAQTLASSTCPPLTAASSDAVKDALDNICFDAGLIDRTMRASKTGYATVRTYRGIGVRRIETTTFAAEFIRPWRHQHGTGTLDASIVLFNLDLRDLQSIPQLACFAQSRRSEIWAAFGPSVAPVRPPYRAPASWLIEKTVAVDQIELLFVNRLEVPVALAFEHEVVRRVYVTCEAGGK